MGGIDTSDREELAPPAEAAPRTAVALHYVSLVVAYVGLLGVGIAKDQWFYFDEWYAVTDWFMPTGSRHSYLLPFNQQWTTSPLLIQRALYEVFALHSYVPYLAVLLAFHVGVAHLLWRVCRSVGVSTWMATAMVAAFLVNGGASQTFFFFFLVNFLGAVVLGLATILLVNRAQPDRRRDVFAAVTAIASLTFSAVGLVMVATAAIVVLLRRGWRNAIGFLVAPVVAFALWWLLWGRKAGAGPDPGRTPLPRRAIPQAPAVVWRGLTWAMDTSTVFVGAGAVLILGLGFFLYTRRDLARTATAPAFAMAAGAAILYLSIGFGRSGGGLDQVLKSRYTYVGWTLLLPAVCLAVDSFAHSPRARMQVAVVLGSILVLSGTDRMVSEVNEQQRREVALRHTVLASAVVVSEEPYLADVVVRREPENREAGSVTAERLATLQRDGKLPGLPTLSEAQRLAAALPLQVRPTSTPTLEADASRGPRVIAVDGGTTRSDADGCVVVSPTGDGRPVVELDVPTPRAIEIRSDRDGAATFSLRGPGGATSGEIQSPVMADEPLYVDLATTSVVVVSLPRDGDSRICGVRDAQ